jgi:hypothetical protein
MDFSEYKGLRAQVVAITEQDVHLGRFLEGLLLHVAHGNGLDPEKEQAKEDDARAKAQAQEEKQAQASAQEGNK